MTATLLPPGDTEETFDATPLDEPRPPVPPERSGDDRVDVRPYLRPALAAGLASVAAALVTGGIFDSWAARALGVAAVALGVGWALLVLRNPSRGTALQLGLIPAAVVSSLPVLIVRGGDPADIGTAVGDAIRSGQLLRPPVPFDAGWAPVLAVVFVLLGFGSAWVATAGGRDRLGLVLPMPVVALTAMTQPDDGELLAAVFAFVPLVAALAALFGGDGVDARKLSRDFEVKRLGRGAAFTALTVVALVGLSRADVLFPAPAYDPDERAQKPRPIPLSEIRDVVLFEVRTDSGITGPWRTGVLDLYDGSAWRLPPFDEGRLVPLPAGGVVDPKLASKATVEVTFTTRDLANASSLPVLSGTATARLGAALDGLRLDPRTGTFRLTQGRIPAGAEYTLSMPAYPGAAELAAAPPPNGVPAITTEVPSPPAVVRELLEAAPSGSAFARMDFLRTRLRDVVVAAGGGVPIDISPERVNRMLEGPDHTATPFELVAAEALLARWAGVPSRIGFGFDGLNDEEGVRTVRPRNAAQWLEVYFEGHGWVPLIEPPKQAKNELDDEAQQFDPSTLATDEIVVDVFVPVRVQSFAELYQRIRAMIVRVAPFLAAGLLAFALTPSAMRRWRRSKRRRWARAQGPLACIAVEYAELRDLAHDLNVGDRLDGPLEYLDRLTEDDEHRELAWLVARAHYGDLRDLTEEHVRDAEDLSTSLRRRLRKGQPLTVQLIGVLSKASLREPYTDEVPNVVLLDPLGRLARLRRRRRSRRSRLLHRPSLRRFAR